MGRRYLLRLCLLELQEGVSHDQIGDERICMAFSQAPPAARTSGSTPEASSSGITFFGRQSKDLDRSSSLLSRSISRSATVEDRDDAISVARDLGRLDLGFGSPVHSSH